MSDKSIDENYVSSQNQNSYCEWVSDTESFITSRLTDIYHIVILKLQPPKQACLD